ncbi:hypothetical protein H4Q26_013281 [Puccinia striiformis f. sp. tritici PST-130]|uniref:Uncharacterized protein n=1 Tax=Puccinia striiformis f. sp. tritici PST-78 TaxID=1165861 RepID=A0A0L0W2P7_9BASI|nr:hypothetical protein H4Q26_013281 [Puccinia striiformis f. sp. tritici PST-130]KNF05784.1 hypothetical protein PSTG_01181 [Puccinia striiformis f. sp. tritici PST-78]
MVSAVWASGRIWPDGSELDSRRATMTSSCTSDDLKILGTQSLINVYGVYRLSEHPPPPAPISDSIVMVPTTMEGLYLPAHAGSGQFCTVAIREGAGATDDDFDSESEPENLGN